MPKRHKCPIECLCMCHDTGGAHYGQHGDYSECPTRLGKELLPLELDWVS